jgi:hypothetical protein
MGPLASSFSTGSLIQPLIITLKTHRQQTVELTWMRAISSPSRLQLSCWSSSFYGNAFCYIVVWKTLVFIVITTQLFSLLCDRTVTLLWNCNNFALLLQQRWHYWVKGTSHMQHHQGNPIYHNMSLIQTRPPSRGPTAPCRGHSLITSAPHCSNHCWVSQPLVIHDCDGVY